MRDAEREPSGGKVVHDAGTALLPRSQESNLLRRARRAPDRITRKRIQESRVALFCIVKIRDRFVQAGCIKIRQLVLEISERPTYHAEDVRAVHSQSADGMLHEIVGAPKAPVPIHITVRRNPCRGAVRRADNVQATALRIAACGKQSGADMLRNADNIFHDPVRIPENIRIEHLQYVAATHSVFIRRDDECMVDVSVAAGFYVAYRAPEGKRGASLPQDGIRNGQISHERFAFQSAHRCAGYTPASVSARSDACTHGLSSV